MLDEVLEAVGADAGDQLLRRARAHAGALRRGGLLRLVVYPLGAARRHEARRAQESRGAGRGSRGAAWFCRPPGRLPTHSLSLSH